MSPASVQGRAAKRMSRRCKTIQQVQTESDDLPKEQRNLRYSTAVVLPPLLLSMIRNTEYVLRSSGSHATKYAHVT